MAEQNAVESLQAWLMELGNEGRSPRTVAAYDADVSDTLATISQKAGKPTPRLNLTDITRDSLVQAIADFRTRRDPRYTRNPGSAPSERSPARVARRIAAIKVFCKWAFATGRLDSDPAALLKAPKAPKRLPKALDPATARAVMDGDESRWPQRDQLIVTLALTTGLRLEEIATLKMSNLQGNPPSAINVIGKGNKERWLPLPEITRQAIATYLPTRAERLAKMSADSKTLLISTRRRQVGEAKGKPVFSVDASTAGVSYVVDRILKKAGARRRGSRVHILRHTFATLGLRPDPSTGRPAYTLRQLQAALGHANLSTIQVYTEVSAAELERAAEQHPLARG